MTLLHDALAAPPMAGTAPAFAGERAAAAWQKEFARASTASWFPGPLVPPQSRVTKLSPETSIPVRGGPLRTSHSTGDHLQVTGHHMVRSPKAIPQTSGELQNPSPDVNRDDRSRSGPAGLVVRYPAYEATEEKAIPCSRAADESRPALPVSSATTSS